MFSGRHLQVGLHSLSLNNNFGDKAAPLVSTEWPLPQHLDLGWHNFSLLLA
jgi:hypothetical protein